MKLAISNIAWGSKKDIEMFNLMKKYDYQGLEIAPTRIIENTPYDKLKEARLWKEKLEQSYGFEVPSMQSIWYGRQEMLFGSEEEREILKSYTKKAIDFAKVIGSKNLVFGCPRNRKLDEKSDCKIAWGFFKELGNYAFSNGCVIGMEANPAIYNTNYINDTLSAIELVKRVDSNGFKLNLDIGTMIQNDENVEILKDNVQYVSHVHISEPRLVPIEERKLHKEVIKILKKGGYHDFVSIEQSKTEDMDRIETVLSYVKELVED